MLLIITLQKPVESAEQAEQITRIVYDKLVEYPDVKIASQTRETINPTEQGDDT